MDANSWNAIIASYPEPHILQTWQWGELKSHFDWKPIYKIWGAPDHPEAAALILQRQIVLGGFGARLRILYAPKGPLIRNWADESIRNQVFDDLRELARQQGAIFIKMDPDLLLGTGIPGTDGGRANPLAPAILQEFGARGWVYSADQIQFRNTVLMDLNPSADDILARMKQKTRYNIRLAERKGVRVRSGTVDDFASLYRMYAETSLRDGFAIRGENYYQKLWGIFIQSGSPTLEPLIAEVDGVPVAAIMLFRFAGRAYYIHGMSRLDHRNKMPNYLLQWEAIRRSKETGCHTYDLWGAPEIFDESDSMWNVFRFKQGLGGEVNRTMGAYDLTTRPLIYKLYAQVLPRVLDVLRNRGKARTQNIQTS